jgi:hypothetical protein
MTTVTNMAMVRDFKETYDELIAIGVCTSENYEQMISELYYKFIVFASFIILTESLEGNKLGVLPKTCCF